MKSSFAWSLFVLLPAALIGCSSVEATKLPNGGYRILCEKGMADCVGRAEKICYGKGYTILAGENATHRIGGSSSSYQDVVYVGQLEVVCGSVKVAEPVCSPTPATPVTLSAAPAVVTPAPATPAPAARLCIPGAAQGCVGPGGCQGGQSCLADGSGYAACDCGGSRAAAPTTPAPAAPAPVTPGATPPAEPLRKP
ncbi:MAG TPA: hypothetical protein VLC09_19260 [Polyangiaceae bacterium]|nr:hypothetical protein [Polyangiaceae bacterium]